MTDKYKPAFIILLISGGLFLLTLFLKSHHLVLLDPKGIIALKERDLILASLGLMLIIVIPVFIFAFFSAWRYRDGNTKARYEPETDKGGKKELIWWILPSIIIAILAVMNWKSTHELDPYKPIASENEAVTIQVVALNWKWLFIYPDQNIATVNFVQFPENTPIIFKLTADAPMNSFWIPQLGSQIYAMPGMSTKLNLMANEQGEFNGAAAEINGRGFAGMKFIAKATSESDFNQWVEWVRQKNSTLSFDKYNELAKPSENEPVIYYSSVENNMYDKIIMKYMSTESMHHHE